MLEVLASIALPYEIISLNAQCRDHAANSLLADAHRDRRILRKPLNQFSCTLIDGARINDLCHKPSLTRLVGGKHLAREKDALHPTHA